MRKIRIFISSPGDVQQERNIARDVISDINKLYSRYANIQVLMWEDFPLPANSTFQEGINYFL
jgi:uridine kinase